MVGCGVPLRVGALVHWVRPRREFGPAADPLSLCRQRKGAKKATLPTRPSRCEGCLALLGLCGSGRTRYAPCRRCAQTAARSQLLMRAARAPQSPALLSSSEGGDNTRSASLRSRRCDARRRPGWLRSNDRIALRVPLVSRRAAQGFAAARDSAHQRLTSRRLFERSGRRPRSEFGAAAKTEQRRAVGPEDRPTSRVAFSLVTFFWRSKRKLLPCRGHIPTRSHAVGKNNNAKRHQRHTASISQPERLVMCEQPGFPPSRE